MSLIQSTAAGSCSVKCEAHQPELICPQRVDPQVVAYHQGQLALPPEILQKAPHIAPIRSLVIGHDPA